MMGKQPKMTGWLKRHVEEQVNYLIYKIEEMIKYTDPTPCFIEIDNILEWYEQAIGAERL